jgi:uncharacterized protein YjiS (DUF1127 family)
MQRIPARVDHENHEDMTMNPIRLAKNWLSYRRTISELSNLPSHTLSDIGLTRYDIRMVAARHAR